jgi:protoporphyrinogen/coproporphyrinogen III oxidase
MLSTGSLPRIVIVGGGITGLSAAFRLESSAPQVETILIESESRLGGKILTEHIDGFIIEGGPDSFLSSKPHGFDLCRQLGIENQLEAPNPDCRRTYVMRDGELYPMPEGLTGLIPSRLAPMFRSPLISPAAKLRLGLDYLIPSRNGNSDESLGDFVERRLGRQVYERLVEPLMAGIYAGDGKELSLDATFPQLRQMETQHGGLLRGIRSSTKYNGASANRRSGFLALHSGMEAMVDALVAKLDHTRILLSQTVSSLGEGQGEYVIAPENGRELTADAVILATPAYVSGALLQPINSFLSSVLRTIPYASTATVSLAYPRDAIPHRLDGYGYVIPRKEGRPALACTWTSSKFPNRSPGGQCLLRVFLGRSGEENMLDLSDDQLLSLARDELRKTLGISARPQLWRLFRWPMAMPQYVLGHTEHLDTIEQGLKVHPGLFLAGNAYRGVGIPDCIKSGEEAALAALREVTIPPEKRNRRANNVASPANRWRSRPDLNRRSPP